jgi:hypothetical protein
MYNHFKLYFLFLKKEKNGFKKKNIKYKINYEIRYWKYVNKSKFKRKVEWKKK